MSIWDFFTGSQRRVQLGVATYMDTWLTCMHSFRDTWEVYLADGLGEEFFSCVDDTAKEETRAGDLRRKIEHEMYAKALIPGSRDNIQGVLEAADILLSTAKRILFTLRLQEMILPQEVHSDVTKLVDVVCACAEIVNRAVRVLFVDWGAAGEVLPLVDKIDAFVSEMDRQACNIIREIFRMDLPTGEKILLKDLIRQLANVCDLAEQIGGRVFIASVKRLV